MHKPHMMLNSMLALTPPCACLGPHDPQTITPTSLEGRLSSEQCRPHIDVAHVALEGLRPVGDAISGGQVQLRDEQLVPAQHVAAWCSAGSTHACNHPSRYRHDTFECRTMVAVTMTSTKRVTCCCTVALWPQDQVRSSLERMLQLVKVLR